MKQADERLIKAVLNLKEEDDIPQGVQDVISEFRGMLHTLDGHGDGGIPRMDLLILIMWGVRREAQNMKRAGTGPKKKVLAGVE